MKHFADLGERLGAQSAVLRAAQARRPLFPVLTMSLDVAVVGLVVGVASIVYHAFAYGHLGNVTLTLELAILLGGLFLFTNLLQRRYRLNRYLTSKGQILEAFNAWNITMLAFVALGFLTRGVDTYSRAVVVLTYVVGIPVIALARAGLARAVMRASRAGRITTQTVLLVGHREDMESFIGRHQPWTFGFSIAGAVTLRQAPSSEPQLAKALLHEDLATAVARVRQIRPDSVFIALPWSERATIEACIDALMTTPVSIHLAPEKVLDRFDNPRILRTGSISSLELTPPTRSVLQGVIKRGFDLVAASLILLLTAPLLALIALAIRIEGNGPIIFRQRRYGFNQQAFTIWKFRTMTVNEDGPVVRQAQRNDPRVTRVGAFLRRFSLDELPQLLNVLQGHMSLVGPRPHALVHDQQYAEKISLYARRHNVRPGLTGWAQIHGLRGETDTDAKMAARVAHDIWYIDNWSFWLDIAILLRTVSPATFRNAH